MCSVPNIAPLKGCGFVRNALAINMSLLWSEETAAASLGVVIINVRRASACRSVHIRMSELVVKMTSRKLRRRQAEARRTFSSEPAHVITTDNAEQVLVLRSQLYCERLLPDSVSPRFFQSPILKSHHSITTTRELLTMCRNESNGGSESSLRHYQF
jgi:hypothetical protein